MADNLPEETPLPVMQMFCVFMVQICEAINVNVLFPFLAFMIEDLGYTGSRLGVYAGGLAAAFCMAQFSSSMLWGVISDTYGRKVAIVFGTFGAALGMLVFGSAKNYPQAVIGRVLGGFLSGNLGVMKSFLTEITDVTNRGKGFAYVSVSWSLGSMVAPLIGGMLCSPAKKYPSVFSEDSLFGRFPYLLPTLLCASANVLTSFLCMAYMVETRGPKASASSSGTSASNSAGREVELVAPSSGSGRGVGGAARSLLGLVQSKMRVRADPPDQRARPAQPYAPLSSADLDLAQDQQDQEASAATVGGAARTPRRLFRIEDPEDCAELGRARGGAEDDATDAEDEDTPALSPSPAHGPDDEQQQQPSPLHPQQQQQQRKQKQQEQEEEQEELSGWALFRSPPVFYPLINYGLLACAYIILDETLPLFLKLGAGTDTGNSDASNSDGSNSDGSNSDGSNSDAGQAFVFGGRALAWMDDRRMGGAQGGVGMGYSSGGIGLLMSVSGGALIFFSYFALPRLTRLVKLRTLFSWGVVGGIPTTILYPLLPHVPHIHELPLEGFLLLVAVSVLKNVFACLSFTAVMLQVNESVSDAHLGYVNGIGQSLAALSRALGPALGGGLWSLSSRWSLGCFVNFLLVASVLLVCGAVNSRCVQDKDRSLAPRRSGGAASLAAH